MKKSDLFRQHHLQLLLEKYDLQRGPIDVFLRLYFLHNKQLGSKDRAWIVERIYHYFRWKNVIDAYASRASFLTALAMDIDQIINELACTDASFRVGFPKNLYNAVKRSFGEKTDQICLALNEEAPITIRTNLLKTTREDLLKKISQEGIFGYPLTDSRTAIRLTKRYPLFATSAFKEGLFEMQDGGSQAVCDLLKMSPGQTLLDFCAGSGGKTLAIAPQLQGLGQIFLHDIREEALYEARKRTRRASVQNAQIIFPQQKHRLNVLVGKMDVVVVDVPCSGTGTLRRNPDMKWKYTDDQVGRLCAEQKAVFASALRYVKKGGQIMYITCSLLREENQEQKDFFLATYPQLRCCVEFSCDPLTSPHDGFYAVLFQVDCNA